MKKTLVTKPYNGWKNYETWNISLWLRNDEGYVNILLSYLECHKNRIHPTYNHFLEWSGLISEATPDGVAFNEKTLSRRELNKMILEMK